MNCFNPSTHRAPIPPKRAHTKVTISVHLPTAVDMPWGGGEEKWTHKVKYPATAFVCLGHHLVAMGEQFAALEAQRGDLRWQ